MRKKEIMALTNEEASHIMYKVFVKYAKTNLVLMIKNIKSEIIFIILENIGALLIIFVT